MEKIAKRNRDFLDSNFPGLSHFIGSPVPPDAFSYITNPAPNIAKDGTTVHSKRHPEREAHNLIHDIPVQPGIVVLFLGLGLGYQVDLLKRRFAGNKTDATFIIVERSTELFSLLCKHGDISFLENTHLFIGESQGDIQAFIEQFGTFNFSGYRIVKLRGSHSLYSDYYEQVELLFKERIAGKLSDLLTRFAFESLWMRNSIDNVPSLIGSRSISSLRGALRGRPVLVVNAGPSLISQLPLLHSIQNRIHLIAVDTVLTPLLKTGIAPDFVVTLDAGFHNSLDFNHLFTGSSNGCKMKLVADIVTNPIILSHWKGPLFFSETSLAATGDTVHGSPVMPLFDLLHRSFPPIDSLSCGGSISTTALELALFLEAEPVYTTALDLSYTDYKTHVNSSPHYEVMYRRSCRLATIATAMLKAIKERKLMTLPALHGGKILSDYVFSQYVGWIERQCRYQNRVINCTAQGVAVKGLSHLKLDTLVRSDALPDRKAAVNAVTGAALTVKEASSFLTDMKHAVQETQADIQRERKCSSLRNTEHLFHTIFAKAEKMHRDSESLHRYMSMFLVFMNRHIDRALTRIKINNMK